MYFRKLMAVQLDRLFGLASDSSIKAAVDDLYHSLFADQDVGGTERDWCHMARQLVCVYRNEPNLRPEINDIFVRLFEDSNIKTTLMADPVLWIKPIPVLKRLSEAGAAGGALDVAEDVLRGILSLLGLPSDVSQFEGMASFESARYDAMLKVDGSSFNNALAMYLPSVTAGVIRNVVLDSPLDFIRMVAKPLVADNTEYGQFFLHFLQMATTGNLSVSGAVALAAVNFAGAALQSAATQVDAGLFPDGPKTPAQLAVQNTLHELPGTLLTLAEHPKIQQAVRGYLPDLDLMATWADSRVAKTLETALDQLSGRLPEGMLDTACLVMMGLVAGKMGSRGNIIFSAVCIGFFSQRAHAKQSTVSDNSESCQKILRVCQKEGVSCDITPNSDGKLVIYFAGVHANKPGATYISPHMNRVLDALSAAFPGQKIPVLVEGIPLMPGDRINNLRQVDESSRNILRSRNIGPGLGSQYRMVPSERHETLILRPEEGALLLDHLPRSGLNELQTSVRQAQERGAISDSTGDAYAKLFCTIAALDAERITGCSASRREQEFNADLKKVMAHNSIVVIVRGVNHAFSDPLIEGSPAMESTDVVIRTGGSRDEQESSIFNLAVRRSADEKEELGVIAGQCAEYGRPIATRSERRSVVYSDTDVTNRAWGDGLRSRIKDQMSGVLAGLKRDEMESRISTVKPEFPW